ncbi:MAG: hypothetical protein AAF357_04090, partial [Verrucomicrobiota bacterium]
GCRLSVVGCRLSVVGCRLSEHTNHAATTPHKLILRTFALSHFRTESGGRGRGNASPRSETFYLLPVTFYSAKGAPPLPLFD